MLQQTHTHTEAKAKLLLQETERGNLQRLCLVPHAALRPLTLPGSADLLTSFRLGARYEVRDVGVVADAGGQVW